MKFGIVLAGEEHSAGRLVQIGRRAERHGFDFAFVSDHFHPWNLNQGHSSNIWPLLGALATATQRLQLYSAVTCPILRLHPTTLAQAAATVWQLSQGRFGLGLGTGENLNEHIVGEGWPPYRERLARLLEATRILRYLWRGEEVNFEGDYFRVRRARLFDPPQGMEVLFGASGPNTTEAAGRLADGLITLGPRPELARLFPGPKLAHLSVCWDPDEQRARLQAYRVFPEVAMAGCTFARLETPADFQRQAQTVRPEDVAAAIPCGPDPARYLELLDQCRDAGYEGVAWHQIGSGQEGFMEFCRRHLMLGTV